MRGKHILKGAVKDRSMCRRRIQVSHSATGLALAQLTWDAIARCRAAR